LRCLNNILALLLHSPISNNIASTCTASIFFLVSTSYPFSSATEVKASSCFLYNDFRRHSEASLSVQLALLEIAPRKELMVLPFFENSMPYL